MGDGIALQRGGGVPRHPKIGVKNKSQKKPRGKASQKNGWLTLPSPIRAFMYHVKSHLIWRSMGERRSWKKRLLAGSQASCWAGPFPGRWVPSAFRKALVPIPPVAWRQRRAPGRGGGGVQSPSPLVILFCSNATFFTKIFAPFLAKF